MYFPYVHPAVERRCELANDYIYLHHSSRRLDLQSPLAMAPLSPSHSPELIDNSYLTGVYSTESATKSAFLVYIYILEIRADDIANVLPAKLYEMQKCGAPISNVSLTNSMTIDPS